MSIYIGYCLTTKSVDDIKKAIADVLSLNQRHFNGIREEKALSRLYCEKTISLLDHWFEDTYGVDKCKQKLKPYKDSDNIEMLRIGKRYSDELLLEINGMLGNMIPLKDLPSCKPLLDCTNDLAIECVKDMANNRFAKIGLGLVSMLSKVNDKVTIQSVWQYYDNMIQELEREVQMDSWSLTPAEQLLYDKAKAERGYCFKAMLKTDVGFVHELKGIIDEATANDDIRKYEKTISNDANVIKTGYYG